MLDQEVSPSSVQCPLLLDLRRQLLLAHPDAPRRALWPDELLLLVEALDQPTTPLLPVEFFGVAHAELLPLCAVVARARYGHYAPWTLAGSEVRRECTFRALR